MRSTPIRGPDSCQVAEWLDDVLLVGGFSKAHEPWLQAYDAGGTPLGERKLPYVDKTAGMDRGMMFSLVHEGRWYLWLPAQVEILAFDTSLELQGAYPLDLPAELSQTPTGFTYLLHTQRDDPRRLLELCHEKIGKTIAVFPKGLFAMGEGLALAFFQVELKGCNGAQTNDLTQFLDIVAGTRFIFLHGQTLAREPRGDRFWPQVTAGGFFGKSSSFLVKTSANYADPNMPAKLKIWTLKP